MRKLIGKMRGDRAPRSPRADLRTIGLAFTGSALAIAILSSLTQTLGTALIVGTFGASTLLVFGYPDAAFSQPRNLVFGHLLGAIIGLLFLNFLGDSSWSLAFATATVIAAMMFTHTVHPPASSNTFAIFLIKPTWVFLLTPILLGSMIILIIALLYNNLVREARWPKHW
jgi:CBS-domain-containing membrane protein